MPSRLRNLAKMTTPTTGTGSITLGAADTGFLSFSQAGVQDGDTVTYVLEEGNNREIGRGVVGGSVTTLTRTVLNSTNSNNPISLAGAAKVGILPAAEDMPIGKQEIWISAGAMKPRAANGAARGNYDSGSNDVTLDVLDFDQATQEFAHFNWALPKAWDRDTITFTPYWTADSSSGTVAFTLAGVAISDNEALNAAMGTAQSSSDTLQNTGRVHVGPESAAITISGSPQAGDLVCFQLARDVANDTLAADARLIGIMLNINVSAGNDT